MKKRKRSYSYSTVNYWQSYSDLMAALLLMFVLITMGILVKSNIDYQKKLEEQEESNKKIMMQNEELKDQQEIMKEQEKKINELIGVKAQIIEELRNSFNNIDLTVKIDNNTGAIEFPSSVLFDYDDAKIKESGEIILNEFLPVYVNSILNKEFKDYVSEIIVEGYTDNEGEYIYNLELSQKRAFSVSKYCLENPQIFDDSIDFDYLKMILTTNGKSENNLKYDDEGNIDSESSRRVEFKFRLKDDEMINEMKDILEDDKIQENE